ncbi:MAG: NAD(P)/FAD-dependent oxidoreductase [Bacteroidota bacterium]
MIKEIELVLNPEQAFHLKANTHLIAQKLRVEKNDINGYSIIKRSLDARNRQVLMRLQLRVFINEEFNANLNKPTFHYKDVRKSQKVIVVGAGPAGLFAALRLIELGLQPIILERGKDVSSRKLDIAQLNRKGIVDPNSNYCFGEGGAGTFSDGKLYTRSTKRGDVGRILQILVNHGAQAEILYDAHPHIGSDKLPAIIQSIRETITKAGGSFHFGVKVSNLVIKDNAAKGVVDQHGNLFEGKAVILATGHSSRDTYEMLQQQNVKLEAKPFAMGIRVEHPQALIDSVQYHSKVRSPYLPAAEYALVQQVNNRGVFSFCMCPGGIIVPSATESSQVVVNGMSNSNRNSPYANSGIVVSVNLQDLSNPDDPLSGLNLQQQIENSAFLASGQTQKAPAQRLTDFLLSKMSTSIPDTSYHPGTISAPLHEMLPSWITSSLQKGFSLFDNKIKGFITENAVLLGFETRTSSPVRILRDSESMQSQNIANLYPCGEGSGYAGGIVSSAIDGENVAVKIASSV